VSSIPVSRYCADVLVPVAGHGPATRNVMVTGYAPTLEESFAKAVESASYYVQDDAIDYPFAEVHVHACCAKCDGYGRVSKTRRGKIVPFGWLECPVCEGAGTWPAGRAVTLVRRLHA